MKFDHHLRSCQAAYDSNWQFKILGMMSLAILAL
jgi:hypothetical protein